MASTPNILGTLVIIVMKAKNLPNKVKIGKQNPFATLAYGINKKKTTTIERGGQAPTWDEEFRFEIPEDMDDVVADGAMVSKTGGVLPVSTVAAPATLVKEKPLPGKKMGKKVLRLACWADDSRDPKLIGEVHIELDEILKKGAKDAWFELTGKSRYAGEIFLEMTFYSNAEPPPKTVKLPVPVASVYGGPGGRVDDGLDPDDGGVDDWEDDRLRNSSRNSSRSHRSAVHEFSADYPDADVRPLSHSLSSLSIRGALPTPPNVGGGTYSGQGPVTDRPQYDDRRSSFPHSYPPEQQQYDDRRTSYGGYPATVEHQPQYGGGGGGFEAVAEQYASQTFSTIAQQHPQRYSPSQSPYQPNAPAYHPAAQQPPWTQQQQQQQPAFLPPPPPLPIFSPPPPPPQAFGLPPPPPSFSPAPNGSTFYPSPEPPVPPPPPSTFQNFGYNNAPPQFPPPPPQFYPPTEQHQQQPQHYSGPHQLQQQQHYGPSPASPAPWSQQPSQQQPQFPQPPQQSHFPQSLQQAQFQPPPPSQFAPPPPPHQFSTHPPPFQPPPPAQYATLPSHALPQPPSNGYGRFPPQAPQPPPPRQDPLAPYNPYATQPQQGLDRDGGEYYQ